MNKSNVPTILILIDAFSYKYLSEEFTPFLQNLANIYFFHKIKPIFAYRGIETTIFTGTSIKKHNIWTEYRLNTKIKGKKEKLKFAILKNIIKIVNFIPYAFFHKAARYFIQKYVDESFVPGAIPPNLLEFFERSQKSILKPNSQNTPTLFDIFRKTHINFKFLAPPIEDIDKIVFKKTINSIKTDKYDFLYVKFGNLDHLGHNFGPDSDELIKGLKVIDNYVKNIYKRLESNYSSFNLILMSDHGMTKVKKKIDVIGKLKNIDFKFPKDYVLFIDSTMIRFWFKNIEAKKTIKNLLSNLKEGYFLNSSNIEDLGLKNIGTLYGEEIFVLKEGYVFSPDFFRDDSQPKGMHGYAYESDYPILIIKCDKEKIRNNNVHFLDIMPTILNLTKLNIPNSCEGLSLLMTNGD